MDDVACLGAAQVDRHANLNSTVTCDYDYPKIRLSGAGGVPEIAVGCGEVVVVPHLQRAFFERLGFRGRGPTNWDLAVAAEAAVTGESEERELEALRELLAL